MSDGPKDYGWLRWFGLLIPVLAIPLAVLIASTGVLDIDPESGRTGGAFVFGVTIGSLWGAWRFWKTDGLM